MSKQQIIINKKTEQSISCSIDKKEPEQG